MVLFPDSFRSRGQGAQCRAGRAAAAGSPVAIIVYPDSHHDFDHPDLAVRELKGLAYAADKSGRAHTGTNPAARADAIARVPSLLAR